MSVNNKFDQLTKRLRTDLRLFISISLGIFLFILFFEPFPPVNPNINNYLVYVAGLSGIIFISLVLVRTILPWLINEKIDSTDIKVLSHPYLKGFMILIISSVSFEFYLRYVGLVNINFFVSFKVVFICLTPIFTIGVYDTINVLRQEIDFQHAEMNLIQRQVNKYEEDYLNKTVEFVSENITENFKLLLSDVAFIRSADNYVEIVFREGGAFKKKLIRNTLKNIEQQIRQYSNFIRCHRICIVNIYFIDKLTRNNESYWLDIKGYNEQIPVSRQYILKLKEAI